MRGTWSHTVRENNYAVIIECPMCHRKHAVYNVTPGIKQVTLDHRSADECEMWVEGIHATVIGVARCNDCGHPIHWGDGLGFDDGGCDQCYCGHLPDTDLAERPRLVDEDLDA